MQLPKDIIREISKNLTTKDLSVLSQVSKKFHETLKPILDVKKHEEEKRKAGIFSSSLKKITNVLRKKKIKKYINNFLDEIFWWNM